MNNIRLYSGIIVGICAFGVLFLVNSAILPNNGMSASAFIGLLIACPIIIFGEDDGDHVPLNGHHAELG